jgi:hypothetical protein
MIPPVCKSGVTGRVTRGNIRESASSVPILPACTTSQRMWDPNVSYLLVVSSRYPYFARSYPYFAHLTSGTVVLPLPTEEGISEEFEGCQYQISPRTVAEVENSKLCTLVDLTELDRTGFDDAGI